MQVVTQGLIIKEQAVGESDRLVTILTKDEGVVRAFARRAKNLKDSKNAATGLLCYSRLKLSKGRGYIQRQRGLPHRGVFRPAQGRDRPGPGPILLPAGRGAGARGRGVLRVPAAGAQRAALFVPGHPAPAFAQSHCGAAHGQRGGLYAQPGLLRQLRRYQAERMYFKINRGELYCKSCYIHTGDPCAPLSPAALTAMRHIVLSDFEKIFSFSVSPGALGELSAAAEAYTVEILQNAPKPWISTTACCKGKFLAAFRVKNGGFPGNIRDKKVK